MTRYDELKRRRPNGYGPATTKHRDGHCIVVCGLCQHESIGDFFGAVWTEPPNAKDAWQQHQQHVDAKHPLPRDLRPSDYLGERAQNLGGPPTGAFSTSMEYAPPGTRAWTYKARVLIHDFYVRVGARWGRGNYYRRFKEALNGIH
jgi:hypothetical protein